MLDIVFVADYVSPYCMTTLKALRLVLKESGVRANITWQPLELTIEPKPRVDTWNDEVLCARYQTLEGPCREMGLDMKLPPHVVPRPYTHLAFEGWYYACEQGMGDEWNDLMFKAYFTQERDIGDIEVLRQLAEEIGFNVPDFTEAMESRRYKDMLRQAVRYTRDVLKLTTVPTIFVNDEKITLPGYSLDDMRKALAGYLAE